MQKKKIFLAIGLLIATVIATNIRTVLAAISVPRSLNYQGVLIDSTTGLPFAGDHVIRFSIWSDDDFDAGTDLDGTGAIDVAAPDFSGYQEEQTFSVDANGVFNLSIGEVVPLPEFEFDVHRFLQVEIKEVGEPDTAFEVLDPDVLDPLSDRSLLDSAPYAINADFIDNREIGTGSGNIVELNEDAQIDLQHIPGGTNNSNFIIDNNDDEPTIIQLQFGNALNKTLSFDITDDVFQFNDSVEIEGALEISDDLNVSGNTTLGTSTGTDTLTINAVIDNNVDFGQNEAVNFVLEKGIEFPTAPVAGQKFFRTDLGEEFVFDGTDWVSTTANSGTGANFTTLILSPEYPGFTVEPDGTNNVGTLSSIFQNFSGSRMTLYEWQTNNNTSLQDVDIIVRVPLPSDFIQFQAIPLQFSYRTDSANLAENSLNLTMFDSNGDPVALTNNTNLVNTNFTTNNITITGGTFLPNTTVTFVINMNAIDNNNAYAGDIILNYSDQ